MNKSVVSLVSVVLISMYLAAPVMALSGLIEAMRKADADKLSQYVDFPAVRSSLKDQIGKAMFADPNMADNPFAIAIGGALINAAIDGMLTPAALAAMLNKGNGSAPSGDRPAVINLQKIAGGFSLRSPFEFRLWPKTDNPDDRVELKFVNSGLANWRLVDIIIPKSALTKKAAAAR